MKAGNGIYAGPDSVPDAIPVFPLPCALLLPRGQLPLNIFEPRYIAMVDAAMASDRLIGIIQPRPGEALPIGQAPALCPVGCVGRVTSFAETGDGRYRISLTGIARFRVVEEMAVLTPFRQCRIETRSYETDFIDCAGEEGVDREALLEAFRAYLKRHDMEADWDGVAAASNETLVNVLAMMSPYGAVEKQALLEAPDLKSRAETLIALTRFSLGSHPGGSESMQ